MTTREWCLDKSKWPDGAWITEPDVVAWIDVTTMYRCVLRRNMVGAWTGVVGVSGAHPFYMCEYDHKYFTQIDVHGDVTTACFNSIDDRFFAPPQRSWWVGFSAMQELDYCPGYTPKHKTLQSFATKDLSVYRDLAYVTDELGFLAAQLFQYEPETSHR